MYNPIGDCLRPDTLKRLTAQVNSASDTSIHCYCCQLESLQVGAEHMSSNAAQKHRPTCLGQNTVAHLRCQKPFTIMQCVEANVFRLLCMLISGRVSKMKAAKVYWGIRKLDWGIRKLDMRDLHVLVTDWSCYIIVDHLPNVKREYDAHPQSSGYAAWPAQCGRPCCA